MVFVFLPRNIYYNILANKLSCQACPKLFFEKNKILDKCLKEALIRGDTNTWSEWVIMLCSQQDKNAWYNKKYYFLLLEGIIFMHNSGKILKFTMNTSTRLTVLQQQGAFVCRTGRDEEATK